MKKDTFFSKKKQKQEMQEFKPVSCARPIDVDFPLSINSVFLIVAPQSIVIARENTSIWCERLIHENTPISLVIALVNQKHVFYFSEDKQVLETKLDFPIYRFQPHLGFLLDQADLIFVFNATYTYGLLRQPYNILAHNVSCATIHHLQTTTTTTTTQENKPNYFPENRMIHWRRRTWNIIDNLREQTYRSMYLEEFYELNPQFIPTTKETTLGPYLNQKNLIQTYQSGNYNQLCVILAIQIKLLQNTWRILIKSQCIEKKIKNVYDPSKGIDKQEETIKSKKVMITYPKTEHKTAKTQLIFQPIPRQQFLEFQNMSNENKNI